MDVPKVRLCPAQAYIHQTERSPVVTADTTPPVRTTSDPDPALAPRVASLR